mmetsp:Transcript_110138/g.310535  ORF Transcript_110138/g.310535 Transcript_110138/m.310535 type:complete len:223 (+) Transcript_110138:786-1454(+)
MPTRSRMKSRARAGPIEAARWHSRASAALSHASRRQRNAPKAAQLSQATDPAASAHGVASAVADAIAAAAAGGAKPGPLMNTASQVAALSTGAPPLQPPRRPADSARQSPSCSVRPKASTGSASVARPRQEWTNRRGPPIARTLTTACRRKATWKASFRGTIPQRKPSASARKAHVSARIVTRYTAEYHRCFNSACPAELHRHDTWEQASPPSSFSPKTPRK